jgi:TRAP-type C4-dicarboxylate transport system substrate-binding protein
LEAAEVSMLVNRGMAELSDALGIKELAEKGMQIYTPNAEELKAFKDATQPRVLEYIRSVVKDATWVDRILNEAAQAEAELAALGQ